MSMIWGHHLTSDIDKNARVAFIASMKNIINEKVSHNLLHGISKDAEIDPVFKVIFLLDGCTDTGKLKEMKREAITILSTSKFGSLYTEPLFQDAKEWRMSLL